ncbi:MAG: hypothetical protein ACYTG4_07205 [Planctomycetota bacterium]|jgi:hypothetical protein
MAKKRKSKGSRPLGTPPSRSDVPAPSDVSTREPSAGLSTDLAAVVGGMPLLTAAVLLVLSVAVGLSFGGVLENEFLNWDDDKYITDNLYVLSRTRPSSTGTRSPTSCTRRRSRPGGWSLACTTPPAWCCTD